MSSASPVSGTSADLESSTARFFACVPPARTILLLLFAFGLLGCIDKFVADVDVPSPRPLVVDGRVTSGPGPHTVTLSLAAAFERSQEGRLARVENAQVSIVDDSTGNRVSLSHTGLGIYEASEDELPGIPGHAYHLEVTLPDGRQYRSRPEQMPEPVPLDSAFVRYTPGPAQRIKVFAAADDPEASTNYYRWSLRVTRKHPIQSLTPPFACWTEVDGRSQVPILEDRLIDGGRIARQTVFSIPTGFNASRLHQVDVQQLTITEAAYEFWSKVEEQVEDADDPFSAPPRPIRGNIIPVQDSIDSALGYFEAAGTSRRVTVCFQQSNFEEAPRGIRPEDGCPPANDVSQGVVFEAPSYWICSSG